MKYHFELKDVEHVKELRKNWLFFMYDFFEEKIVFSSSNTTFWAFLNPHIIKSDETSTVLLFAHDRGKTPKIFRCSISIGLIQGKRISRIKHGSSFTFYISPQETFCVQFPLKANNTPKGKYRIGVKVEECGEKVHDLAAGFSVGFLSEFLFSSVSRITYNVPSKILSLWALKKLGDRKVKVSMADPSYLASEIGFEGALDYFEKGVTKGSKYNSPVLSGMVEGILWEMMGVNLQPLILIVE
ncbi:MAG: hypothetical protein HXS41_14395 [Theionarchaea archaeon]|nr:hypothetical protein [Theionarchaea archaeon]